MPEKNLNAKKESIEKVKISIPETIWFSLLALQADGLEVIGPFMIAIDFGVTWAIGWIDGFSSSTAIFIWLLFRNLSDQSDTNVGFLMKQIIKRRIAPAITGFLADSILGGFLPIRTVTLSLIIILNNHNCRKELKKLEEK